MQCRPLTVGGPALGPGTTFGRDSRRQGRASGSKRTGQRKERGTEGLGRFRRKPQPLLGSKASLLILSSGLEKSFTDLGAFSNSTAQRLDDVYYSVLEKTSNLQTAVVGLKELAEMSRGVQATFELDTKALVRDIGGQLDQFGRFEQQQNGIEILQARIRNGRSRITELSDRVEVVRSRIEGWERKDKEWQERTRRRLKAIWIFTLMIIFAVLGLLLGAQYAPPLVEVSSMAAEAGGVSHATTVTVGRVEEIVSVVDPSASDTAEQSFQFIPSVRSHTGYDDSLRAFDEL